MTLTSFCELYEMDVKSKLKLNTWLTVNTFENYILRIDCNKAEDGLKTTPFSQNSLNELAIDELLEYARLALDGEMQAWVDVIDSLEIW